MLENFETHNLIYVPAPSPGAGKLVLLKWREGRLYALHESKKRGITPIRYEFGSLGWRSVPEAELPPELQKILCTIHGGN